MSQDIVKQMMKEELQMAKDEYYNTDTGEIINLNDYVKKEDLHKRKEGYQRYLDILNNKFYWGNMQNIKTLLEQNKIKLSTLGAILVLGAYINHQDTLICKADDKKTPYTAKEIRENILKISKPTFKRFVKECKSTGILIIEGKGNNASFKLNKDFHFVGRQESNEMSSKMVRIYKDGVISMYRSGLSLDDIGFIYLVLPYVDYKNCTIVNEPFSENSRGLTYREIGDLLKFSRGTLSKHLNVTFEHDFGKGRYSNKYKVNVFGKFIAGTDGKYAFCVNPIILRRCTKQKGTIKYDELESIFKTVGTKVQ